MTVRCVLQLFRTFLAENSESLLGFHTISRWAQISFTDSLETHSKIEWQHQEPHSVE